MKRNDAATAGSRLYLTKPLGIGIFTTAEKKALLRPQDVGLARDVMCTLNKPGSRFGKLAGVTAMTDVTGFGLLGHLIEMIGNAPLSIEIYYDQIPIIEAAKKYLTQRIVPDATYRNWNHYQSDVVFGNNVNVMEAFNLLPDPQTNGGLLIAVAPEIEKEMAGILANHKLENYAVPIGKVVKQKEKKISVIAA